MFLLQVCQQIPMFGRSRPVVAQPLQHALTARHRAVEIFASKPRRLERFLKMAKLISAMSPPVILFGYLEGEACHESKAILKVP